MGGAGAADDFVERLLAALGGGQFLKRGLGMMGARRWSAGAAPARWTKRSAASSPPSRTSAPISASTTSPTTLSLWLAPSSRACLPSRMSAECRARGRCRRRSRARPAHCSGGKIAFGLARMAVVESARHDVAENAVAEEFEPLIVSPRPCSCGTAPARTAKGRSADGRAGRGRSQQVPAHSASPV